MTTAKSISVLLDNIDTGYLSELEKAKIAASAERAELVSQAISHTANLIKQFAIHLKNSLPQVSHKGQQA